MLALARNFARNGFDVTVLPNRSYKNSEPFRVINIPLIKPLRIIAKRFILKLLLKDDDIVVCDSWKSINAVTRKFKGRLIVLAHGQEYLKGRKYQRRVQKALDRASLVVANSKFTAELIQRRFTIASDNLTVIPPTYMVETTAPPQKEEHNGEVNLVSICRLDKRKGLREAIIAVSEAEDIKCKWRWDIIGNGSEAKPLKNLVKELDLEENIQFRHDVIDSQKPAIMKRADLFIMTSYQTGRSVEGFGISYIEAAQYGVPAIAGNSGGSVDAVIDGETGWCVDPQNIDQLRDTLTIAINSKEERTDRGMAAYNRFINEFSGPKVTKNFIDSMMKEKKER